MEQVLETVEKKGPGRPKKEAAVARPTASGQIVDRPYLYNDDARLKEWKKKWPGTRFCLVHNVDFRTGQRNDYPVMEYEAKGYVVLSEEASVVRHPGHVLMGINAEYYDEIESERLRLSNRDKVGRDEQTDKLGDGEVQTITERSETCTLGDILD